MGEDGILIYVNDVCPFCVKAKELLNKLGLKFQEVNVGDSSEMRNEMIKKAGGRRTVPQIFIYGKHIGGCDDLYSLHESGELSSMIS